MGACGQDKLALKKVPETESFNHYIDPPRIAVQVPATKKQELEVQTLEVELTQIPEKIVPNTPIPATVSTKMGNQTVRPQLSAVKVILQSIEQDKIELGPLPIFVRLPADMIGTHELEWQDEGDKQIQVEVIGPPAELSKLKTTGGEKVWAYIDLRATHAEPSDAYYPVPVKLSFSEDIHDVKLAGTPKEVRVRLRKLLEK